GLPDMAEHELMEKLVGTYGKTWHTWHSDLDKTLPLGVPQLMMGFTADGQADPEMVAERDRRFGIDSARKRADRQDIESPPIDPGADAWQRDRVIQIEDPTGSVHEAGPAADPGQGPDTNTSTRSGKPCGGHRPAAPAVSGRYVRATLRRSLARWRPDGTGGRAELHSTRPCWSKVTRLPARSSTTRSGPTWTTRAPCRSSVSSCSRAASARGVNFESCRARFACARAWRAWIVCVMESSLMQTVRRQQTPESRCVAGLMETAIRGAPGRSRTCTSRGHQPLKLARLPVPPRAPERLALAMPTGQVFGIPPCEEQGSGSESLSPGPAGRTEPERIP